MAVCMSKRRDEDKKDSFIFFPLRRGKKRFHDPYPQLIKAIVKQFDDVEGVNADGSLFKIDGSDVFIRTMHVNDDVLNT